MSSLNIQFLMVWSQRISSLQGCEDLKQRLAEVKAAVRAGAKPKRRSWSQMYSQHDPTKIGISWGDYMILLDNMGIMGYIALYKTQQYDICVCVADNGEPIPS